MPYLTVDRACKVCDWYAKGSYCDITKQVASILKKYHPLSTAQPEDISNELRMVWSFFWNNCIPEYKYNKNFNENFIRNSNLTDCAKEILLLIYNNRERFSGCGYTIYSCINRYLKCLKGELFFVAENQDWYSITFDNYKMIDVGNVDPDEVYRHVKVTELLQPKLIDVDGDGRKDTIVHRLKILSDGNYIISPTFDVASVGVESFYTWYYGKKVFVKKGEHIYNVYIPFVYNARWFGMKSINFAKSEIASRHPSFKDVMNGNKYYNVDYCPDGSKCFLVYTFTNLDSLLNYLYKPVFGSRYNVTAVDLDCDERNDSYLAIFNVTDINPDSYIYGYFKVNNSKVFFNKKLTYHSGRLCSCGKVAVMYVSNNSGWHKYNTRLLLFNKYGVKSDYGTFKTLYIAPHPYITKYEPNYEFTALFVESSIFRSFVLASGGETPISISIKLNNGDIKKYTITDENLVFSNIGRPVYYTNINVGSFENISNVEVKDKNGKTAYVKLAKYSGRRYYD